MKAGAFLVQHPITIPAVKAERFLGRLSAADLALVEAGGVIGSAFDPGERKAEPKPRLALVPTFLLETLFSDRFLLMPGDLENAVAPDFVPERLEVRIINGGELELNRFLQFEGLHQPAAGFFE